MTDNITLPRAVGELVQDLIDHAYNDGVEKFQYRSEQTTQAEKALLDRFAALAKPEKVPHTHEWFRTGAMEPEVMRCISCGEWGKSALAEPEQKPEPVAWMYVNLEGECEQIEYGTPSIDDDSITLLYAAPPAAPPAAALAEPETVAVDLAKEGSDKTVISFVTLPRAAKREPATEKQVTEAYMAKGSEDWWSDYQAGWREAERFHGIRGSKT